MRLGAGLPPPSVLSAPLGPKQRVRSAALAHVAGSSESGGAWRRLPQTHAPLWGGGLLVSSCKPNLHREV